SLPRGTTGGHSGKVEGGAEPRARRPAGDKRRARPWGGGHKENVMTVRLSRAAILSIPFSLATVPAFAHHMMGGRTPSTFMEGLLSGLGHPVIGLDHLAFLLAVGVAVGVFG